jgi:CheY-like chemotaxis protein
MDATLTALDESSPQSKELVASRSLNKAQGKLNLLLAEDNPINQKYAIRLLEKSGHKVTLANNGVEAVQQFQNGNFDAILMDVDMPEMNGYEATRRIRELELASGQHIFILAMTAHAMRGAREECLSHGMDEYLSKPIDTEMLWKKLNRLPSIVVKGAPVVQEQRSSAVADFERALKAMGGDRELFGEMVEMFQEDSPQHLQCIKEALAQGNAKEVRHRAHMLKGMIGTFAAEPAKQAASQVEQLAGKDECSGAVVELERALGELQAAISSFWQRS